MTGSISRVTMPEHPHTGYHLGDQSPLSRALSLALNVPDEDDDGDHNFVLYDSPEPDSPGFLDSLLDSPSPYSLPGHMSLADDLTRSQSTYVEPTMIGAIYSSPMPSCPHYPSSPSHSPLQNPFHSPSISQYQLALPQISQPAIAVSDTPPEKGLPRCALPGTLDPTTGIFYRTPEHTRLRTAQACEKCRIRKAKCSGDHPTCQRCHMRGLTCHYSPEGRIRGPNKPKLKVEVKSDDQLSMNTRASASGSPSSGQTARPTLRSNISNSPLHQCRHTDTDVPRITRNAISKPVATSTIASVARRRDSLETNTSTTNVRLSGIVPGTLTQVGVKSGSKGNGVGSNGTSVRGSRTPSTSSSTSPIITRSNSIGLPKTPESCRNSPFEITSSSPRVRQHSHDTHLFANGSGTIGMNTNYTYPLTDVEVDDHHGVFGEYMEWREVKEELREGRFFS